MLKAVPLILIIIVLFALPPLDPDLGWFYRCGHADCSINTFSVFLPNYHWARPMVIYPKIIAFIFDHFSFNGLTILNVTIGLLSFFFFHKILKTNLVVSALAFIFSTLLSFSALSLGLRNQSLSIPFFLATIYFLTQRSVIANPEHSRGVKQSQPIYNFPTGLLRSLTLPRNDIAIIIIFILWPNLHPSFPIGLALVFLYRNYKFLILSFITTLINPFGPAIYQDIFSHFQIPMNTLVAEWVKPPAFISLTIIIITAITLIVKKLNPFSFFSLLFIGIFSLTAIRNLPYFYFLFPLFVFSKFKIPFEKIIALLSIPVLIFFTSSILPKTIDINTNWNSYCHKGVTNFPCEAVEFLKNKPPGNIFHTYEWGGFLIWQLPEFKTFVDGRAPAWRTENNISPYKTYLETYQTLPGWQKTLEDYKIDYILISPGTFLDLELKKNIYPWKEIFKSQYSVLYKK